MKFFVKKILVAQGWSRKIEFIEQLEPRTEDELTDSLKQRANLITDMAKWWQDQGISALICPIWPSAGPTMKQALDAGLMLEYSALWNTNTFPAGVMPVTEFQKEDEEFEDSFNDKYTELVRDMNKNSAGLPVPI